MSYKKKPKTINPDEIDPSVYYYDEVYDDMQKEKDANQGKTNEESRSMGPQTSKYIQGLIETAEQRKTEKEIRKFKRYAKDREEAEADGDLNPEDVYVTPTYKRKLEEIKRLDEAKKRRLVTEQSKSLNFSKINESKSEPKDTTENSVDLDQKEETTPKQEVEVQKSVCDNIVENSTAEDPPKPVRTKPKTIEERREFLRKALAKQTVGDAFEAAVQRYKERRKCQT